MAKAAGRRAALLAMVLGAWIWGFPGSSLGPESAWANGGDDGMTAEDLARTLAGEWRVTSVRDAVIPPDASATLRFEPDRVSGFSGCNNFSATLDYGSDGAVRLGEVRLTRRICGQPAMAMEVQIVRALRRTTQVRLSPGGGLVLMTFETPTVEAERVAPPTMP